MSVIYDTINDFLISEKGASIVKGSEEKAFTTLRGIQEQHGYVDSEGFYDFLRPDEDRWMEDNFGSDPKAKHPGTGKRSGWKYRTYMPGKYWNARTTIGAAIDKGINVTGKGKSQLQKEVAGEKEESATTKAVASNLEKFQKAWINCKTYFNSMSEIEKVSALDYLYKHSIT